MDQVRDQWTTRFVLWSSPPSPDKGLHATYWAPNEPNLTPLVERSVQIHWNGISGTGKARIFRHAVFHVILLREWQWCW